MLINFVNLQYKDSNLSRVVTLSPPIFNSQEALIYSKHSFHQSECKDKVLRASANLLLGMYQENKEHKIRCSSVRFWVFKDYLSCSHPGGNTVKNVRVGPLESPWNYHTYLFLHAEINTSVLFWLAHSTHTCDLTTESSISMQCWQKIIP